MLGSTGFPRGLDCDLSCFSPFALRVPSRGLRSRDFVLDDLTRPFVPLVATTGGVVPLLVFTKVPFPFVYPSL